MQCYARKVSQENRRKLPAISFYSVASQCRAFELKKKKKKKKKRGWEGGRKEEEEKRWNREKKEKS